MSLLVTTRSYTASYIPLYVETARIPSKAVAEQLVAIPEILLAVRHLTEVSSMLLIIHWCTAQACGDFLLCRPCSHMIVFFAVGRMELNCCEHI